MKQLIDSDLGLILVFLISLSLKTINSYFTLIIAVIGILVGFVTLIKLLQTFKYNQLERKIKEKQLEGF